MRCDWNLTQTQFEIVLEYFQGDAIAILTKTQFEVVLEYFRRIEVGLRKF